jgi:hypothetical protein
LSLARFHAGGTRLSYDFFLLLRQKGNRWKEGEATIKPRSSDNPSCQTFGHAGLNNSKISYLARYADFLTATGAKL